MLSKETIALIQKEITDPEVDWDGIKSSNEHDSLLLAGKLNEVEEELINYNWEYLSELEFDELIRAMELNIRKIAKELEVDEEELPIYEVATEYRDHFEVNCDLNLRDYFSGNMNCVISFYSDYDCINSHWYEGSYEYKESYFGDVVDLLRLNPVLVKKALNEMEVETEGEFPDKPERNGKELVGYGEFVKELMESISPANLWVFPCSVPLVELMEPGSIKTVFLAKGMECGLFSASSGGGSMIGCPLIKDVELSLGEVKGIDSAELSIAADGESGYSIQETYGVANSFFSEVEIRKEVASADTEKN